MPEQPAYKTLEVYGLSKQLAVACYELTHGLPADEKSNFTRYIRTAALNLHINIAQGAFQKPKKRKYFIREAKNALVIIDAATEILVELRLVTVEDTELIKTLSEKCFQLLEEME
ncbi:MAG: four helix bundle protein [Flavisolibacter sp.]